MTESLTAGVQAWAPGSLTTLKIDDASCRIEERRRGRIGILVSDSPTKQLFQKRIYRTIMGELQPYERDLVTAGKVRRALQSNCNWMVRHAPPSQVVQSLKA